MCDGLDYACSKHTTIYATIHTNSAYSCALQLKAVHDNFQQRLEMLTHHKKFTISTSVSDY